MKRAAAIALACAAGCWSEATVGVIPRRPTDAGAPTDVALDLLPAIDVPDAGDVVDSPDIGDEATVDAPDVGEDRPPPCAEGFDRCGGDECVRLQTSRNHCGRCGHRCTTACIDGQCGEELVDVAIGISHTCVARYDGRVFCWGDNSSGQLGDGGRLWSATPVAVAKVTDATEVVAGANHTCVLHRGGLLSCWGLNDAGQLGNGSIRSNPFPEYVFGIPDAVRVAVGISFSCAVNRTGAVLCWGYNGSGNLGIGTINDQLMPAPLGTWFNPVTRLACGREHTCALRDGRVWCWGQDDYGALGRGHTGPPALLPEAVPNFAEVVEVGTGASHTCARRDGGTVWCWGNNTGGQLGDGMRTASSSPVQVLGLANIQQLAVAPGQDFSCALDARSIPWCWGSNDVGQLGRGFVGPVGASGEPAQVMIGAWQVARLRAGGQRACGILSTHRGLVCWGYNESGTFGSLTPRMSGVPIEVPLPDLP